VVASLSWGLATATSKYALAGFSAVDLLALEIAVGTLALWCVPAVRARARRAFRRSYLGLGLLEPAGAYVLFNLGLERTSAADGALLVSLESLVIALLAAVFLGERLSVGLAAGLALGIGGASLLAEQQTHSDASFLGDGFVLAAVVAAAVYSVAARHLARGADALAVTGYQLVGALAAAIVIWLAASVQGGSRIGEASASQWAAAVFTGFLGSALPFLLFTFAVARLPSSRAAPVLNLIPFFGVGAAVAVLGERLSVSQLLGGVLIVAGLGTAQLRVRAG
jgi:drug/metabolite transporter (DMT)-like permease